MLNNPFCYTPSPSIVRESVRLCSLIRASDELNAVFSEGKMLGILEFETSRGEPGFLYAYSGRRIPEAEVHGIPFAPPIFDYEPSVIASSSPEESKCLQKWLFEQYVVLNGLGEKRSVSDIFASRGLFPPGGTGDCAAPKLLQAAFLAGLKPCAMGEFWYGDSPLGEVRRHGDFYPSCTGKCGPLLEYMLQGVEVEPNPLESDRLWALEEPFIRYEDDAVIVVEKPSGMLSVPGRTARRCLQQWLAGKCGCTVYTCHRLDMDTSGLMVYAKTLSAQSNLQRQFENREVSKKYVAVLSGPALQNPDGKELKEGARGKISLPLMPDYYDRPRQRVDFENGKPAVTDYEIIGIRPDGTIGVQFIPYTGRTHQLRVHAAHRLGLGHPILGDRLYGGNGCRCEADGADGADAAGSSRLMLHASYLSFRHPSNGSRLCFESRAF